MRYNTVKVFFCKDEVSTLPELAEELKVTYDWASWSVSADGRNIVFTAKDSDDAVVKKGYVGPSGFAYHLEDDEDDQFEENETNSWQEYDVDWSADLGWSDCVWGENSDGDTVMVHG